MKPECFDIVTEHSWTDYLLERAMTHMLERRAGDARTTLLMARESLSTEDARRRLGSELVEVGLQGLDALPSLVEVESIAVARAIQQFRRLFREQAVDKACQCEYGLGSSQ